LTFVLLAGYNGEFRLKFDVEALSLLDGLTTLFLIVVGEVIGELVLFIGSWGTAFFEFPVEEEDTIVEVVVFCVFIGLENI